VTSDIGIDNDMEGHLRRIPPPSARLKGGDASAGDGTVAPGSGPGRPGAVRVKRDAASRPRPGGVTCGRNRTRSTALGLHAEDHLPLAARAGLGEPDADRADLTV